MKHQLAATIAAVLLTAVSLSAQITATGTLKGVVYDSSHSVVPNAEVTVSSKATGFKRSANSGGQGDYTLTLLPADSYEVTVKAAGFTTAQFPKVDIQVGLATQLDATLATGAQTETVTVTTEVSQIDTTKTEVSMAVTPSDVQNLPLNGRDFANLAFLAPGVKPVNSYDPTKNRVAVFATNGSSGRNVNVTINGIDDKDNSVGGPVMQMPLEAVEEFSISTQRFSAANGRTSGSAVNLITKSGTNNYHGSLFLSERDTSLNANDYFSAQGGQPTSPFSRQQYGGGFGMPIVKDKTFVFFALERTRELTELPVTPNAFKQLSLVTSLGAVPTNSIPTPFNEQRYNGRLDHRFTPSQALSLAYTSQSNTGLNDQAASTNDLTAGNFTSNRMILASANLNSIVSPTIVNSLTVGYQYWNNVIDSNKKVPYVLFPSAAFGTNPNVPQQSIQAKWQYKDDVSLTRGRHSIKTGYDFVNEPKLGGFFQTPSTLNVTFLDDPTVITSDATKYPNGFSTPGAVTAMSASAGNPYFTSVNAKMLGFYGQDDWKVTRRLNINIGVRWDKDFNLNGGNTQNLDRTYLALKAINSPYAGGLPKNDSKDFSPRFGFALDIAGNGKHVLRGGYGIYYDQIFQNIPLFTEQQENDTLFTQVLSLTSTGPGDPNASVVPGAGKILSQYRYGVDPLPTIPAPSKSLPAGAVGRLVDPNYRNPFSQQFNVGYAYQLTPNDVIEVDVIHNLAIRESKRQNLNWINFATGKRVYDDAFVAAGLPKLAQIIMESSIGRSRYDALNIAYRRRLNRHFSINTNYVRSRALAYAGNAAAFGNPATDPTNLFSVSDFGPTPTDEKHRVLFSGVLQAKWGIQVAPIAQWATGRPINATEGLDVYGFGSGNGTWRAVVPSGDRTNYQFTKSFIAAQLRAGLADGSLVTLPYDYLRSPRFFQVDMRVSKAFKFGERHKLDLMANLYDLTNHANFGTTQTSLISIRSATFLKPSGFFSTSGVIIPHAFSAEMGFRYSF